MRVLLLLSLAFSVQAQLRWRLLHNGVSSTAPKARRDSAIGYDPQDNAVYVFGGRSDVLHNDLWRFSLNTSTWEELNVSGSSIPEPRFSMVGGFYVRGRQFVISTGEGASKTFFNDVWSYNTQTSRWTRLPANGKVPETRYGGTGGIHMDSSGLWVTHGFSRTRYSNTFRYDLEAQTWQEEFGGASKYSYTEPHPRCLMGGAMVGPEETMFYGGCLSGGKSGGPCPSVDSWTKVRGESWRRMDDCASPRQFSGVAAWPGQARSAVMFGGGERDRSVIRANFAEDNEVNFLNVVTKKWQRLASLPVGNGSLPVWRRSNAMVAAMTTVVMFGGIRRSSDGGALLNDVWMLEGTVEGSATVGSCGPNWFLYMHLHGFFMILSWGILLQLGAFIARYFREYNPLWFKLHQGFQVSGFVLSFLGIILVFPGTRALPNFAHTIFGILLLLGSIQQVINGACRPHKQEGDQQPKKRVYWEYWHKNIGRFMLLLAAINISLGVFLIIAPAGVIAVWFLIFGLFVIAYIVMEIRLQLKKKNA